MREDPGRKNIMLCYPFEEKRLAKWHMPALIAQKLDGRRAIATLDSEGKCTLRSSEGNILTKFPQINRELESYHLTNLELDGEIYRHGFSFEQVMTDSNADKMQFHIFDMIAQYPLHLRLLGIGALFPKLVSENDSSYDTGALVRVDHELVYDLEDILEKYEQYIEDNYEGFVVKERDSYYIKRYNPYRSPWWMKFKPHQQDVYMIVGYEEEVSIHGVNKNSLGALVLSSDPNHTDVTATFRVGTGFTADQRRTLWANREYLVGQFARVKYQHISSANKVPRFPVFVEIYNPNKR